MIYLKKWPFISFIFASISFGASGPKEAPVQTLNVFQIVLESGPVVMGVLIVLLLFFFLSVSIVLSKWKEIEDSEESIDTFLDVFWSGKSMDNIYGESKKFPDAPVARIFQSGYKELQRLMEKEKQKGREAESTNLGALIPPESSIENLERSLTMANRSESLKLEKNMTFLATAASTSPFIGLFGTVWGIIDSFRNIGAQGGASLAVVAPGIAEALVATAAGIFCALLATVGYNYFYHRIRHIRMKMENFSSDFLNIVKRNFLAH